MTARKRGRPALAPSMKRHMETIGIRGDVRDALRRAAKRRGVTLSALCNEILIW